jgi:hypothetical protein
VETSAGRVEGLDWGCDYGFNVAIKVLFDLRRQLGNFHSLLQGDLPDRKDQFDPDIIPPQRDQ